MILQHCPPQGQDNIYDDPYQPEMDQPQPVSAGRRRAYYRNRDHFATIRTASLVRLTIKAFLHLVENVASAGDRGQVILKSLFSR